MDIATISAVFSAAFTGLTALIALSRAGQVQGEERLRILRSLHREVNRKPLELDLSMVRAGFSALYRHVHAWATEDLIFLKKELRDCERTLPDLLMAHTLYSLDRMSRRLSLKKGGRWLWIFQEVGLFIGAGILLAASLAASFHELPIAGEPPWLLVLRAALMWILSAYLFATVFRMQHAWRLPSEFRTALRSGLDTPP